MDISTKGLTLVEILVAIVILAVALLGLAATMTEGMSGIRNDGRRTAANQVATSILEDIRFGIRNPVQASVVVDCGVPCSRSGAWDAGAQAYEYAFDVVPRKVDETGALSPGTEADHHVLEVTVSVTSPTGSTYDYRTVVARNP